LLLAASYWFYMAWRVEFALVLLASTVIAHLGGLAVATAAPAARKRTLAVGIGAALALLGWFKYTNFAIGNLNAVLDVAGRPPLPWLDIVLPIGISFHTFQAIAYMVDVYRGYPVERRFDRVALYMAFFPQSVAGPIERPAEMIGQFDRFWPATYDDVAAGLRLILWGLVKKVVIADRLAVYVDQVYDHPGDHGGLAATLAIYFFAFQIYCDFSGYTDIARGSARLFGIELVPNFRRPYLASSPTEFWRRWHMSLSLWFRDYVYLPLGGSRRGAGRNAANIMATFVLSGFWHGASWTFVAWGAIHGLVLLAGRALPVPRGRLAGFVGWLATFHAVVVAWVFFRAKTFGDAFVLLGNALTKASTPLVFDGGLPRSQLVLAGGLAVGLLAVEWLAEHGRLAAWFSARPRALRWAAYYAAVYLVLLFPGGAGARAFIYFQF
ncbi:MAG: MBOAT family O-acyltransferase, partial [Actinomycetota bacterium]